MNIYQKLQKARVLLQEKNLKKSGENKFSGFKYYELADFLPSVNKIFEEVGLSSIFNLTEDKAILTIINSEKTDEIQQFTTPIARVELKGCTEIQAVGALVTYSKRYLYMNALEIVEHDILDENAGNPQVIENKPTSKPVESDKPTCPICGKPTNSKALEVWGCCSTCKANKVKENKEKAQSL